MRHAKLEENCYFNRFPLKLITLHPTCTLIIYTQPANLNKFLFVIQG